MGKDLDKLSEVITGVLHEEHPDVGTKPEQGLPVFVGGSDGNRDSLAAVQLNRDKDPKSGKAQDPNKKDTERMKDKGVFLLKGILSVSLKCCLSDLHRKSCQMDFSLSFWVNALLSTKENLCFHAFYSHTLFLFQANKQTAQTKSPLTR